MKINLAIELPDDATKEDIVKAIRNAGERAAGQVEFDILPTPLEVDEVIQMGSDVDGVEVELFRSE